MSNRKFEIMSNRKFTRAIIGDIVEIPLASGFAYVQYVYNYTKPPVWGALIRVFPGIFKKRPEEFSELNKIQERFVAFSPIRHAVHRKMVPIVAHEPVPDRFKKLPLFKAAGARDEKTGAVRVWWLWDGKKSWRIAALTEEQKHLPLKQIINFPLLVERIESGWAPEDEVSESKPRKK